MVTLDGVKSFLKPKNVQNPGKIHLSVPTRYTGNADGGVFTESEGIVHFHFFVLESK